MIAPSRREAFRFWLKLGFISFGGPAGQIAIMHREVVDRRRWVDEHTFLQALDFCMLLPGPEALQLAIWLGWRLHGTAGGIVAGLCFILPSIALLLALSFVYALHGDVPLVAAGLTGLKATVVALILQALVRIGRRALAHPLHLALAIAAFALIYFRLVPFPLVVLGAGLAGMAIAPRAGPAPPPGAPARLPWRILAGGLALWAAPAAAVLATAGPGSLQAAVYRFFTIAAFVTFGGAYAVLTWVNQQVVEAYGWVSHAETVAGLALAETTPGPLIIVLQFVGFMTGWNAGGNDPAALATATAMLASWATFLPSFVLILLAAPWVERLAANRRVAAALSGITAAVVGVIASLALVFGRNVLFPEGWAAPEWGAVAIAVGAFALLTWTRLDVLWVIGAGLAAGLVLGFA